MCELRENGSNPGLQHRASQAREPSAVRQKPVTLPQQN